ncbi:MAG: DNA primase [Myxococcota bacterium]|nr:DNA primase [Myxococcota bacterium]
MIPDEIIAEVLSRTDIVAYVGRQVDLRKAGTLFKGLCPFHDEKTPSFTVSPTRNTYHCFGCGAHGNAIRFLMETGARNFPEAVRELAAECGVEVPEARAETPEQKRAREQQKSLKRRLLDVQDALTAYYSDQLFSMVGSGARQYLQNRGMSRRAAQAFRLGWASDDRQALDRWMQSKAIALDDLVALGIVIKPDEGWAEQRPLRGGRLRFRERLMFPVIDFRGDVTGYSARILDDRKKTAKYLNSPETPVFTKGEQLYGAFTARSAARRAGRVVLCEGNVDVIALWDAGLEGTVAAMGTALTDKQVRLVKRLSDQVVCVMDGDAAGQKAAFASLLPFLENGIQPRAVSMPAGEDPDSFIRSFGVKRLNARLDDAPPLLDLLIERMHAEHPNDPPGRVAALRAIAPALALLKDPLSLELYRDRLIERLGLSGSIVDKAVTEAGEADGVRGSISPMPVGPVDGTRPVPEPFEDSRLPDGLNAVFTGATLAPPDRQTPANLPKIFIPGYIGQVFVFIMQFPELIQALFDAGLEKLLTQDDLAGFVLRLHAEICAGKTPNMDRLIRQVEHPQVVALLRDCQSQPPSLDLEASKTAFTGALRRLERGGLVQRRETLKKALKAAYPASPEQCAEISTELKSIQARLLELNEPMSEGVH